jgi:hypothetical protein
LLGASLSLGKSAILQVVAFEFQEIKGVIDDLPIARLPRLSCASPGHAPFRDNSRDVRIRGSYFGNQFDRR